MLAGSLCLILLAAPPGDEGGSDIDLLDAPQEQGIAAEAKRLEALILHILPNNEQLTIAEGDTVFLEQAVPFTGASLGELEPDLSEVKASKGGLSILPVLELIDRPGSQPAQGTAIVRYAIRVQGLKDTARITAKLRLVDADGKTARGTLAISHEVAPQTGTAQTGDVELNRKAYLWFQREAEAQYQALKGLHDYLRLDRLDRPPSRSRMGKTPAEVKKFYALRLRAEVARARLRAAAESADTTVANAAVLALGSLSKKPTGPAAKARAIEGLVTAEALATTKAALEDLRIDEAEGFLNKLRNGGHLDKAELATALELQGAIDTVRGRAALAHVDYNRAFCIDPQLKAVLQRPFFARLFAEASAKKTCQQPIAISDASATRIGTDQGLRIVVVAHFGPDPYKLITGGEVQLWGSGGEVHSAERTRTSEDGSHLEATFADTGDLENYAGQLLVKVMLRDLSGVKIASLGDPDPLPMTVTAGESSSSFSVPLWLWLVVGGVVVAGAATAGVILATSGETKNGIGPIAVTF